MSDNLYTLFTTQFSANLEMRLQQTASLLRSRVETGTHVGKQASPVQYMGPVAMSDVTVRFAPLGRTDASFMRRWVFPIDSDLNQLIDSFDELKTIVDPKSKYSVNAAAAAGRKWDDRIIAASRATAYTGTDVNGLTTETWASVVTAYGTQVAADFKASAAVGLTVAKMIEAKRVLRHNHALDDGRESSLYMICGSKQESDLLSQVQVVSTEFNDKPVLTDGKVSRFLGFDIIYTERLEVASNVRSVLAGVKDAMYLGMWKDLTNQASQRTDLSGHPYQLYTTMSCGATRLEPGRMVEVLCSDTTGADITP